MMLFRRCSQLVRRCGHRYTSSVVTAKANRIEIWDELVEPKGDKVKLTTRYPGVLSWYSCGPTVYDSAHIGHASSYIRLDIIRRILESEGLTVLQVMGVTDIDDKIITRSQLQNIPWTHLGRKYELEFFHDLQRLNVKMPDVKARVSQFIPQIISFVSDLVSLNLAYPTPNGTVYFDTSRYPRYGIFRQSRTSEELSQDASERIGAKRNPQDFALWKGAKQGEPFWETQWGRGRPGWHIECSVIATHFFGPSLDIHTGGMDLTFPHHENEEAQCCAKFSEAKWVSHWIHTGHLHLTGDVKMSKSIGNTVSIEEFLRKNPADVLRMLCLMKKYNTNIEYNAETEFHAKSLLHRLNTFISDSKAVLIGTKNIGLKAGGATEAELWNKVITARSAIETSLLNNFDTPSAVITLLELIGEINRNYEIVTEGMGTSIGIDLRLVLTTLNTVRDFFTLVGLTPLGEKQDSSADSSHFLLEHILSESIDFRRRVRDFSLAGSEKDKFVRKAKLEERLELMDACDEYRKNLGLLGVDIKDHGKDSSWSFKDNAMNRVQAKK